MISHDLVLLLGALITIFALSYANRHHRHVWEDPDEHTPRRSRK